MSITDELRKEVFYAPMEPDQRGRFIAIADRIDAEHERVEQDLIDANNQMEQLCECSIKLPVDADGEVVHIGDVMEWCDSGDTLEVIGIGADDTLFYFDKDSDGEEMADWTSARNKRHHKQPTVEDVLRKFVDRMREDNWGDIPDVNDDTLAEFAAKLQLRGDAE